MLRCWIFNGSGAFRSRADFENRSDALRYASRVVSNGDFFLLYPADVPLSRVIADNPGAFGDTADVAVAV